MNVCKTVKVSDSWGKKKGGPIQEDRFGLFEVEILK